ncbi:MAG: hypothetical protein GKR89_11740 [Candidatus Latescibacteria bacterium]|nr:hypothetical protein [Candidatus Latescibacterota bacterium]
MLHDLIEDQVAVATKLGHSLAEFIVGEFARLAFGGRRCNIHGLFIHT